MRAFRGRKVAVQTKITSWFIVWLAGSAVFLQLATSPAATADTLNLVQTFPDIMAINLDLGYSASTGHVFGVWEGGSTGPRRRIAPGES